MQRALTSQLFARKCRATVLRSWCFLISHEAIALTKLTELARLPSLESPISTPICSPRSILLQQRRAARRQHEKILPRLIRFSARSKLRDLTSNDLALP